MIPKTNLHTLSLWSAEHFQVPTNKNPIILSPYGIITMLMATIVQFLFENVQKNNIGSKIVFRMIQVVSHSLDPSLPTRLLIK